MPGGRHHQGPPGNQGIGRDNQQPQPESLRPIGSTWKQVSKEHKTERIQEKGLTFMYGAKGGTAYIMGNAAGRPLINAVGRPRVVINGTALDYLAESFMAGDPLNGGEFNEISDADWDLILPYLEENEKLFAISIDRLLTVDNKKKSPKEVYRKIMPIKAAAPVKNIDGLSETCK